jgi:molybdopterin/thiamine biosynthesis adenylyltransferase
MTVRNTLDFDRISYLLNPEEFADLKVVIIGLGSGGAPVCDHLVMNGIRNLDLYDPDYLDAVNLVKHPRMRRDLGRPKVDIQKEWIEDRNPEASVTTYAEDVFYSKNIENSIREAHLVLSCTDLKSVRELINVQCVKHKVPCVTASVFRTGIGGEVFGYIPDQTGCYQCLQLYALSHKINLTDSALGLTPEEEERNYGLGDHEFRASGLSIDIQMIALIQVRMALSILKAQRQSPMQLLKSNWIIFGNRPAKGIFNGHFHTRQMRLSPQKLCNCITPQHSNR